MQTNHIPLYGEYVPTNEKADDEPVRESRGLQILLSGIGIVYAVLALSSCVGHP